MVARSRERIARDPDTFDEVDVVLWLVTDTPERSWTPSEVARATGRTTSEAYAALAELADGGHVLRYERGAWTRYQSRNAR